MGTKLASALLLCMVRASLARDVGIHAPDAGALGLASSIQAISSAPGLQPAARLEGASTLLPLQLCDCHFSQLTSADDGGQPEDMSCAGDGFFVAGFERAGVFSSTQREGFPLSSAICCRPCFGSDPESAAAEVDVAAVVSVACELSSYVDGGLSCPPDTFLQGFPDTRVGQPIGKYYAVGQAQCCRPALLYKNGTQRLLRRCDATVAGSCGAPEYGSQVSCSPGDDPGSAQAHGRLAYGYANLLKAPGFGVTTSDSIPQAPAGCCRVCLDPQEPARASPCEALNRCNGRGQCTPSGRCACDAGWAAPDCVQRESGLSFLDAFLNLPTLAAVVAFAAVCACGCFARILQLQRMVMLLAAAARRSAAAAAYGTSAEEQPLLETSDDSDDFSEGEEEEEEGAGGEAGAGDGRLERLLGEAAGEPPAPAAGDEGDVERGPDGVGTAAAAEAPKEGEEGSSAAGEAAAAAARPRRREPLHNECSVCMSARLQCVFLPCGHACACRACARRLRRCPICRTLITRRQKLYIMG